MCFALPISVHVVACVCACAGVRLRPCVRVCVRARVCVLCALFVQMHTVSCLSRHHVLDLSTRCFLSIITHMQLTAASATGVHLQGAWRTDAGHHLGLWPHTGRRAVRLLQLAGAMLHRELGVPSATL